MDLFKIKFINRLYKSAWFPLVLQIAMLISFFLIILGGWGITTDNGKFAKILRNTNISNLLIWSYWWPAIIVSAIIIGRKWCTVCPMELITALMSKIGLKKKPGAFLKSGWVITLGYFIILVYAVQTMVIHRLPHRMAFFMTLLLGAVVLVSLIWEKRTFCSYVCPVGHLLGLYSLLAITKWRVRDENVCLQCTSKACIDKSSHYNLTARSCTSNLFPPKIENNSDCILCTQCHKVCPNDNITFKIRTLFEDLFTSIKLKNAHIAFIVIVCGFVVYEVLSEWNVTKDILMVIPNQIHQMLGLSSFYKDTIKALVVFISFPLIFFLIFGMFHKLTSSNTEENKFSFSLQSLCFAILPIMASMHIVKSLVKSVSRIPYWDHVFTDLRGVTTAQAIFDGVIKLDKTFINTLHPLVSVTTIVLLLVGIIGSILVTNRLKNNNGTQKIIIHIASMTYAGVFAITLLLWRF